VLWSPSSLDQRAPVAPRAAAAFKPSGGRVDTLNNGEGHAVLSSRHGLGLAPSPLGFETGIGSERPPMPGRLEQSPVRLPVLVPVSGMIRGRSAAHGSRKGKRPTNRRQMAPQAIEKTQSATQNGASPVAELKRTGRETRKGSGYVTAKRALRLRSEELRKPS
jgi:hypothetical protein